MRQASFECVRGCARRLTGGLCSQVKHGRGSTGSLRAQRHRWYPSSRCIFLLGRTTRCARCGLYIGCARGGLDVFRSLGCPLYVRRRGGKRVPAMGVPSVGLIWQPPALAPGPDIGSPSVTHLQVRAEDVSPSMEPSPPSGSGVEDCRTPFEKRSSRRKVDVESGTGCRDSASPRQRDH